MEEKIWPQQEKKSPWIHIHKDFLTHSRQIFAQPLRVTKTIGYSFRIFSETFSQKWKPVFGKCCKNKEL